jgi:hypothetical protein
MLTIGIPLYNPNTHQLDWARDVIACVHARHPEIHFVISIHSNVDDPRITETDVLTVLCTEEQYSYDRNVYQISQAVRTRYWMLLACTDRLLIERLPALLEVLKKSDPFTALAFTGAIQPANCSQLLPKRLGFLSSFVFNSNYFKHACPLPRNFRGWIHTAVFLMALQAGELVVPLEFELVEEDIEPGFVKPWTARGGFLVYQVSLARLINMLLSRHAARLACESHATGRWPFDVIKAVLQGVILSTRERRYLLVWNRRQGGFVRILFRLLAQIQARYLVRK